MLSGTRTGASQVTVVLCVPNGAHLSEIQSVLEDTAFTVVARAIDDLDLIAACREHRPQLVVVDEASGPEVPRTARRLAAERPLPVLLVTDREIPDSVDSDNSLRISTIARSAFRNPEPFARRRLRTRLRLLVARGHEVKTTLSKEGLVSMVSELMDEGSGQAPPAEVAALAIEPLDLVCGVVPHSAHGILEQVFSHLETTLVPVVLLADDVRAVSALAQRFRMGAVTLESTLALRRAAGLLLADATTPISMSRDSMLLRNPGTGTAEESLRTMSSIGTGGLSLLFGPDAAADPLTRETIRSSGGKLLRVLESGTRTHEDGWGSETTDVAGLAWLWNHMLPRRL